MQKTAPVDILVMLQLERLNLYLFALFAVRSQLVMRSVLLVESGEYL